MFQQFLDFEVTFMWCWMIWFFGGNDKSGGVGKNFRQSLSINTMLVAAVARATPFFRQSSKKSIKCLFIS